MDDVVWWVGGRRVEAGVGGNDDKEVKEWERRVRGKLCECGVGWMEERVVRSKGKKMNEGGVGGLEEMRKVVLRMSVRERKGREKLKRMKEEMRNMRKEIERVKIWMRKMKTLQQRSVTI